MTFEEYVNEEYGIELKDLEEEGEYRDAISKAGIEEELDDLLEEYQDYCCENGVIADIPGCLSL